MHAQCRECMQRFNMPVFYAWLSIHYTLYKKSYFQAVATIREQLMCRHAVAKVRLLVESGFYSRVAYTRRYGTCTCMPTAYGNTGTCVFTCIILCSWLAYATVAVPNGHGFTMWCRMLWGHHERVATQLVKYVRYRTNIANLSCHMQLLSTWNSATRWYTFGREPTATLFGIIHTFFLWVILAGRCKYHSLLGLQTWSWQHMIQLGNWNWL